MNHSFGVEVAKIYGMEGATIIENFQFWIGKNRANGTHYHDGRYWTYNSAKALNELFPYMSEKVIRRVMKSLIDKKVLMTGNYNETKYDRTLWYAFVDEEYWLSHLPKRANASAQKGKSICPNEEFDLPKQAIPFPQTGGPIPDINTDINSSINTDKEKEEKKSLSNSNLKNSSSFLDAQSVKEICEHFGLTELRNASQWRKINEFVRRLCEIGEIEYFKERFLNYKIYKSLSGESLQGLETFIGFDPDDPMGGGWNRENWTKKLSDYKTKLAIDNGKNKHTSTDSVGELSTEDYYSKL